jgi:hypothetical protein
MAMAKSDPLRCSSHENMLGKSEFRWVIGTLIGILSIILGVIWADKASTERLFAAENKIDRLDIRLDVYEKKADRYHNEVMDELRKRSP